MVHHQKINSSVLSFSKTNFNFLFTLNQMASASLIKNKSYVNMSLICPVHWQKQMNYMFNLTSAQFTCVDWKVQLWFTPF